MTNAEKYKTAKERAEAFFKDVSILFDDSNFEIVEKFCRWLDREVPEEKPLPCPFCGGRTVATTNFGGVSFVMCDCGYSSEQGGDKDNVIAAHNRVARAVAKESEVKE